MTTDGANGVTISFELSPQVSGYLDHMVETGLWGDTREEVALTLIRGRPSPALGVHQRQPAGEGGGARRALGTYLAPLGEVTREECEALAHLLRLLQPRELFKSDDEHLGACLAMVVQRRVRVGRGKGMVVVMQVAAP
jgi:hypothetical protein